MQFHINRKNIFTVISVQSLRSLTCTFINIMNFCIFISGDATYIVEDNLYKIHPGDILLTRPGELHTIFLSVRKAV